jgi:hypothetical protein
MSFVEKRPYELSLWEDIMVENNNREKVLEEQRVCIIGSDSSTSPISAFDVTLNKKVNGEKVLTFSVCSSYLD